MSRKRNHDYEHKEAVALMEWVRLQAGMFPDLRCLFHIPNGGRRNKVSGAKLKAEGVRAGVSDYFLPVASQHYHGLWIELKVKGNYPTPNQYEFMNDMRENGYAAKWCHGWIEASELLIAYLTNQVDLPGRDPKTRGSYKLK